MAIPGYQKFMLPLLKEVSDGDIHQYRDIKESLTEKSGLSDLEKRELLSSGKQTVVDNRIAWAKTYLVKAGLIESPKRAHLQISERGLKVLKNNPAEVDTKFLMQFPEFVEFRSKNKKANDQVQEDENKEKSPHEIIESEINSLNENLIDELLESIANNSPYFFETLVVELLVKMGYGGSLKDAAEVVGKSGDEGIDGIIKEDPLGLDKIYIQAKRWEGSVSRPEIQKFVGALLGKQAKKGVFITTSTFTKGAIEYAASVDSNVVLIDGQKLAELMIEYDLGVSTQQTYVTKVIDTDFFE